MNREVTHNFTREEEEAFRKLKIRILDKYGSHEAEDYQIYRFLKARNFNKKQAETMLIKYIQWKKDYKLETILEDFKVPDVMKKYVQLNLIGHDVEGHPNVYLRFGAIDFKGVLKSEKKENISRYIPYFIAGCEIHLREQSRKLGKPIESWNVILDLEDFPISQAIYKPTIDILSSVLNIYEANYPERLKFGYVINASLAFYIVFNAVKPLVSAATLRKVTFFGKDGWKKVFQEVMDLDELPAFLGGSRTDPDGNEMCVATVNHCGIIPEHYYFRSSDRRLRGQLGVKTYVLNRKGKVNILFHVVEPGSFIEWEFETESYDVAFGLFFEEKPTNKTKPIPLIPTQRVSAHMYIETGTFKCNKPGLYILTLDNSYSWFRQKKIFCRTSIKHPTERVNITIN